MLTRLAPGPVVGLFLGVLTVTLVALVGVFSGGGPASANLATGVQYVAFGSNHACLVNADSGVECWGSNSNGQLGPQGGLFRNSPSAVAALASGVTAVAGGDAFSCALLAAGSVSCWGTNQQGQTGRGNDDLSVPPGNVIGLTTAAAITAGGAHACAVLSGANLSCWGLNATQQLGATSGDDCGTVVISLACSLTPIGITSLAGSVAQASAGALHTCAVTTSGGAMCWGSNSFGQLGDGTNVDRLTPMDVTGLTSGVVQVAAGGQHNCALTGGGGVKCWGLNQFGQLGDGSTAASLTPVDVVGLSSGVATVFVGHDHSCALMLTGSIKCWGDNSIGQLGDGTTVGRHAPTDVIGISGATFGAAGTIGTCVLPVGGSLWCWGSASIVGDGTWLYRTSPTHIKGLSSGIADVSLGAGHACALTTVGGVKCWGNNSEGQLGDGTQTARQLPVDVIGLSSGVIAVSAGAEYTCAVTTTGAVKCWGQSPRAECDPFPCLTPVDVVGIGALAVDVTAGGFFTCALTTAGGVRCWDLVDAPHDIPGLTTGVASVSAGGNHACAVTTSGDARCWGRNGAGQLGDGTMTDSSVPVAALSGAAVVSAGALHTCAVTTGSDVKCWGADDADQLGASSFESCTSLLYTGPCSTTPLDVVALAGTAADVSAGDRHTCAITTSGGAKCWGRNNEGQLGDGSLSGISVPVDVVRLASGVDTVSVDLNSSCALIMAGRVECWGETLGPDDFVQAFPVPVVDVTIKPIPTQTPCGPQGCPTPTDTPTASPTPPATDTPVPGDEPAMALAVLNAAGAEICRSDANAKCEVSTGSSFRVVVEIVRAPVGGYVLAQAWVDWAIYDPTASEDGAGPGTCSDGFDNGFERGDRFDPDCLIDSDIAIEPRPSAVDEIVWPDCLEALALRSGTDDLGYAAHTCLTGLIPPLAKSVHTGRLLELDFNCTEPDTSNDLRLLAYEQDDAGTSGAVFVLSSAEQVVPLVGNLIINCVTPAAVGGVALDGDLRGIAAQEGNARWLWVAVTVGAIAALSAMVIARRRHAVPT